MKKHLLLAILIGLVTNITFALAANTDSMTSATSAPTSTAKVGPLGDLSSFNTIAKDTLKIAQGGDLNAAKKHIKDLETAWDEAEDKQRPMNGDAWRKADKAIDLALKNLRSNVPEQAACVASLQEVISVFDSLQNAK